jgi:hypothetical protein
VSLNLNGTSQYVSVGDAVNLLPGNARPFSIAQLVKPGTLRHGTGLYHGLIEQGDFTTSRGFGTEITNDASSVFFAAINNGGACFGSGTTTIPDSSGWWLLVACFRVVGTSTTIDFLHYRYSTQAFTVNSVTGQADVNPVSPNAGDLTVLGAADGGAISDFFPGLFGWGAIFSVDIGNAAQTGGSVAVWELIERGPWRIVRGEVPSIVAASSCTFFVPLTAEFGLVDKSTGGHNGSLVGSPLYDVPGPTEWPRIYRAQVKTSRPRSFAPGLAR